MTAINPARRYAFRGFFVALAVAASGATAAHSISGIPADFVRPGLSRWQPALDLLRRSQARGNMPRVDAPPMPAGASAPAYHYSALSVSGSDLVFVGDINDAGLAVGFYGDANGVPMPAMWDSDGALHELGAPAGGATAVSVNSSGEIAGFGADADGDVQMLLRWNAADPSQFEVLFASAAVGVVPRSIGEDGTIVGYQGDLATGTDVTAMVWTEADGVVDYGCIDPNNENLQCLLSDISASGRLVGSWLDPSDPSGAKHALVGQLGTPSVQSLGVQTDAANSSLNAINAGGVAAGYDDLGSGTAPMTVGVDGSVTALPPAASFGAALSSAVDISSTGTVVGYAKGAVANTLWVYADGVVRDLFAVSDEPGGLIPSNTIAVNSAGTIVAMGISVDSGSGAFAVQSFRLTPLALDVIFANGFD